MKNFGGMINLTLPEALAVLRQYNPACTSMRLGDREMLAEAERVVGERARDIRGRFWAVATQGSETSEPLQDYDDGDRVERCP